MKKEAKLLSKLEFLGSYVLRGNRTVFELGNVRVVGQYKKGTERSFEVGNVRVMGQSCYRRSSNKPTGGVDIFGFCMGSYSRGGLV